MKKFISIFILLLASSAFAQHQNHPPSHDEKEAKLFTGLSDLQHPVSTKNAEAQKYFNQGLALLYAFNHDEAARSFQHAAELDANLAMAYWGIALANGANYNLGPLPDREKAAYEAIQKALALKSKAAENEQDYINALAKRYSPDPKADFQKLGVDYKNAMSELVKKYPDDLDLATLYAESCMNLRPWKLYTKDGKPEDGTEEIVATLESVLKRNPNHIGANHYYIHAVEASNTPERGLASAYRLKTLAPAAGHLVHMPAHIHMRIGDYENAAAANAQGAEADRAYIKARGPEGFYPLMYYNHNVHFFTIARAFEGNFADAKKGADEIVKFAMPMVKEMAMLDAFTPTDTLILVRFHKWDEILKQPEPDKSIPYTHAIWQFAQGCAYTAKGKLSDAEGALNRLRAKIKDLPKDASLGLNNTADVLKVAENLLAGKIALAKKDNQSAFEYFRAGIIAEDALNYTEPADWYIPVRESLGSALMMNKDYAEAEKVFRADLAKNPRNGRSLFGLLESLKAQNKTIAAQFIQKELETAWKNADTKLRIEDL
jgi:tetratricopeptide (TPR) repeat protein